jgi:hypothetical protein
MCWPLATGASLPGACADWEKAPVAAERSTAGIESAFRSPYFMGTFSSRKTDLDVHGIGGNGDEPRLLKIYTIWGACARKTYKLQE